MKFARRQVKFAPSLTAQVLKDLLWEELSKDVDRHMTMTHRPMEVDDYEEDEDEELGDDIEIEWDDEK